MGTNGTLHESIGVGCGNVPSSFPIKSPGWGKKKKNSW